MDREPPSAGEGADAADAPNPELLAAVERASRHLGAPRGREHGGSALRFDAPRPVARRVKVLGVVLALAVAVAALPSLLLPRTQPADEVEADLRWAVGHVVRQVEALRRRDGRLPDPEQLQVLLGEHVVYEPSGGTYVVTGERDDVRVRYDGTLPLEVWVAQRP
ncbi:MAG: hypothetical protein Q8N53_07605 [Longimicrobiales bacterium]|nr:hypothetical protein [Longimicrobiales bacterium]